MIFLDQYFYFDSQVRNRYHIVRMYKLKLCFLFLGGSLMQDVILYNGSPTALLVNGLSGGLLRRHESANF